MWKKITLANIAIWFLDLGLLVFLIFDFGFKNLQAFRNYKLIVLPTILLALLVFNFYNYRKTKNEPDLNKSSKVSLIVLCFLILFEVIVVLLTYEGSYFETLFQTRSVLEYGLLIYFFVRLTFLLRRIYKFYFNPAILFVGSFALVALAGAFLLMLPSATYNGIEFVDALFTATSATTVTGLVVLDTSKDFTNFGQSIILILIQIGGLGMLSFTSFFAYFFKSGSSFKESLYMKDILGHDNLGEVMKMVMQIVVFALVIEGIGAMFIYLSINSAEIAENTVFFSVFHAISAFCNAGFSIATDGLNSSGLRFNYYIQWVIMVLIIFGGLGYHIALNVIQYIRNFFIKTFTRQKKFISRIIRLNTKIVLYTTLGLLLFGGVFFLFSEQQTILLAHNTWFGKFTTGMFASVTARTAGFNTVDISMFSIPGLLITMLLMWIGASPASTGGGIKTTTFALATLNVFSVARGKKYIEIGTRRIAPEAVQRAFAIVALSLILISIGVMLLLIFNPEFSLVQAAFEVVSAFSTTGLSLGITPFLGENSKYVLILIMFLGRIGLINLMIGILKSVSRGDDYIYPQENILIN